MKNGRKIVTFFLMSVLTISQELMPMSTKVFGGCVTLLVAGHSGLTAKCTHNRWATALQSPFKSLMMAVLVSYTS